MYPLAGDDRPLDLLKQGCASSELAEQLFTVPGRGGMWSVGCKSGHKSRNSLTVNCTDLCCFRKVADVWKKNVWEFQAKSGSSGSCRLFLHFLGKIAVLKMSGRTPGSPRHPSCRHPRPSDVYLGIISKSAQCDQCDAVHQNNGMATASFLANKDWEVLNGVGVDGVGVIFPFFYAFFPFFYAFFPFFYAFFPFFFVFLCFS